MTPLRPGATIGILGGGQLGRMLAVAGAQLGFDMLIYSPEDDPPAGRVATGARKAGWADRGALEAFARDCDAVTLEFENVPVEALTAIEAAGIPVRPGAQSLSVSQDRASEKAFLQGTGIATADYRVIDAEGDIVPALEALGGHGLMKTRREGYDGKGQMRLIRAAAPAMAPPAAAISRPVPPPMVLPSRPPRRRPAATSQASCARWRH